MTTLNSPALTGGGRMRGPAPDIKTGGLPRAFIIGSIVLHVLAFFFAVGVPRWLSSGPSGNKVYVVDLVSLPGGAEQPAPAPPAAAAPAPEPPKAAPAKAPEVKKPEVKPEPRKTQKPIVLPDKDALKKKTTKTPEKPPEKKPAEPLPKKDEPKEKETEPAEDSGTAEETAADAAPPVQTASNAPVKPGGAADAGAAPGTGPGAGAGAGSGTGSGDELTFYLAVVKRRIEAAWKRPVSTSRETRTAAVYVELSPTGRLLKLELKTPSGYAPFDRSIIQAVRDAEPFPPFPLALKMDQLNPILEFELTPLGGDAQP